MADYLFPRKNTQFTTNMNVSISTPQNYIDKYDGAAFSTLDYTNTDFSHEQNIMAAYQDPKPFIEMRLLQHVREWVGTSTQQSCSDITEYEVKFKYRHKFNGDFTISVSNCDSTNIEISPIYYVEMDLSANNELHDAFIVTTDSTFNYLVLKNLGTDCTVFVEIHSLDETDVIIDSTKINISNYTEDSSTLVQLAAGKYLVVFACLSDDDLTATSLSQIHSVTMDNLSQGDVTHLTSRDEISQQYNVFESDVTRVYDNTFTIDTTDTKDFIDQNNGLICQLELGSEEISLYKYKDIIFSNDSTSIDTTFVLKDRDNSVVNEYVSNDVSCNQKLTNYTGDYRIEIYSGDFTFGETYELNFDFTITPFISNYDSIGEVVDFILLLPESYSEFSLGDFIMINGLTDTTA